MKHTIVTLLLILSSQVMATPFLLYGNGLLVCRQPTKQCQQAIELFKIHYVSSECDRSQNRARRLERDLKMAKYEQEGAKSEYNIYHSASRILMLVAPLQVLNVPAMVSTIKITASINLPGGVALGATLFLIGAIGFTVDKIKERRVKNGCVGCSELRKTLRRLRVVRDSLLRLNRLGLERSLQKESGIGLYRYQIPPGLRELESIQQTLFKYKQLMEKSIRWQSGSDHSLSDLLRVIERQVYLRASLVIANIQKEVFCKRGKELFKVQNKRYVDRIFDSIDSGRSLITY